MGDAFLVNENRFPRDEAFLEMEISRLFKQLRHVMSCVTLLMKLETEETSTRFPTVVVN